MKCNVYNFVKKKTEVDNIGCPCCQRPSKSYENFDEKHGYKEFTLGLARVVCM